MGQCIGIECKIFMNKILNTMDIFILQFFLNVLINNLNKQLSIFKSKNNFIEVSSLFKIVY